MKGKIESSQLASCEPRQHLLRLDIVGENQVLQIAPPFGFQRGIRDHDVRAAAAIEFPDQRAANETAASGHQHAASRPSVFSFATRHILELSEALLYSTGLFLEDLVKPARETEHLRILLRRNAIERRVRQLGRQITADFRGQRLHLIGVLKGASIFLSDLIREIRLEVSLDFIAVSSYGQSSPSSGQVRLTKDLDNSIEGLHTILIEDILDTGRTIAYLQRVIRQRKPRSLSVATLLSKTGPRVKQVR